REEYMRDLLWARLIEERRNCPFPLTQDLLEKILEECWAVFERKAKARSASLSVDGRGLDEMRRKLKYASRKWDTKIAAEAKKPKPANKWDDLPAADEPAAQAPPERHVDVAPAFPIDPASIPPRPWI